MKVLQALRWWSHAISILIMFAVFSITPTVNQARASAYNFWTQLHSRESPSPRWGATMAYHEPTRQVVMFGGLEHNGDILSDATRPTDTWTWDGAHWAQKPTDVSPPGRSSALMVYDPQRGVVLLWGGSGEDSRYMWSWDGTRWAQSGILAPDSCCSADYDAARGHIVFYAAGRTYVWDSNKWTERWYHSEKPTSANTTAFVYDASAGLGVLFGGDPPGSYGGKYFSNGTATWDGSVWTKLNPAHSPSGRHTRAFAYDSKARTSVLFGGMDGNNGVLGDTWIWDGRDWIEQRPVAGPSARNGSILVYAPTIGKVMLFGGYELGGSGGARYLNETWVYQAPPTNRLAAPPQSQSGKQPNQSPSANPSKPKAAIRSWVDYWDNQDDPAGNQSSQAGQPGSGPENISYPNTLSTDNESPVTSAASGALEKQEMNYFGSALAAILILGGVVLLSRRSRHPEK